MTYLVIQAYEALLDGCVYGLWSGNSETRVCQGGLVCLVELACDEGDEDLTKLG